MKKILFKLSIITFSVFIIASCLDSDVLLEGSELTDGGSNSSESGTVLKTYDVEVVMVQEVQSTGQSVTTETYAHEEFDQNGKLVDYTMRTVFDFPDGGGQQEVNQESEIFYDGDRLTRFEVISDINIERTVYDFEYNSDGLLIKQIISQYAANSTTAETVHIYNITRTTSSMIIQNIKDGSEINEVNYTVNNEGIPTSRTLQCTGSSNIYRADFTYSSNNLIEVKHYKNNELTHTLNYNYDSNPNPSRQLSDHPLYYLTPITTFGGFTEDDLEDFEITAFMNSDVNEIVKLGSNNSLLAYIYNISDNEFISYPYTLSLNSDNYLVSRLHSYQISLDLFGIVQSNTSNNITETFTYF